MRPFPSLQSKPDSSELGSPKTTDDIVQEKGEEGRAARRRHKTENVKQQRRTLTLRAAKLGNTPDGIKFNRYFFAIELSYFSRLWHLIILRGCMLLK